MFRGDEIDIMDVSHILQFEIPFTKFFRREVLAVPLMCNVVVLAEDTSEIAAGEEDRARAIMTLDTGF